MCAITSESGGTARVNERLLEREVKPAFPVLTDPDLTALPEPRDRSVVLAPQNAAQYGGDYTDYNMVQPALFVLDVTTPEWKTLSWWSWRSYPDFDDTKPTGSWPLIKRRPMSADILPSILEKRPIKLEDLM